MRSWLSLAVLAVLVAALGAWVYYRPAEAPTQTHALSELKPQAVTRIRLVLAQPAETPPIRLEKSDDRWRMLEPFAARAETLQVERLLALLDARSAARYPASDLARFGLDRPQATLTLNEQTFAYGAVNTMTREQYVLTREAVYAIPLAQRTALPRDANALVSRSLFAPGETPVRIETPDVSASLADGAWTITPAAETLTPDERNAWADAWRNASAMQAMRYDGRAAPARVTVELKDGRTVAIGIVAREPELVLARSDEGVEYHFLPEIGKRLLNPPAPREQKSK